jgi:phage regulatory protein, rha family|nr:MAG TPA: regulatory protein [Caudoviricetes sp.]
MNLIKVNIENINGVLVTTSNRVSEELGVLHKDLLEKIDGYSSKFNSAELSAQFYIPHSYKDRSGKRNRSYLITEKGIAQLIGGYSAAVPKAFDLNVAYINKFEEMKETLRKQKTLSIPEQLLANAQYLVEVEKRINSVEEDVEEFKKGMSRLENNQRRTVTSNQLTVIAYANMKGINPKSYHSPTIGRKATKICKDRDILIGTVVDSKYGLINTYPTDVLDEIFF